MDGETFVASDGAVTEFLVEEEPTTEPTPEPKDNKETVIIVVVVVVVVVLLIVIAIGVYVSSLEFTYLHSSR